MDKEKEAVRKLKPYKQWIIGEKIDYSRAYGHCEDICLEMLEIFPELNLVRGHYYDAVWGERGHWWLKTDEGEIVDPTAIQFPTKGNGVYDEWVEGSPEPTGKCPNCGELIWDGKSVHDECYNAFIASMMG